MVARCSIDYSGRLTTHLAEATRLLMTKADGTRVTVKFDKNFNVTSTQDGMGLGGPGGHAGGTAPTSSGAAI